MIEIRDVTWSAGNRVILNHFSATIKDKMVTAIIGPNGAGKSSLVRSILHLITDWTGEISIEGVNLRELSPKDLAQRISYVPQEIPVEQSMSVEEFVMLSRYPWLERWQPFSSTDKTIVENAMKQVNIFSLRTQNLASLSGGERQLAAIAAAVAQETPILIMDEPASNLDPFHSHALYQLMHRISHEQGKSVVIVTHDISSAIRYSDAVILLKDGSLFFEGTAKDATNLELLKELFGMPFSLLHDYNGESVVIPGGRDER